MDVDDLVRRLEAGTHIRDDIWMNPTPLATEAAAALRALQARVGELEVGLRRILDATEDGDEMAAVEMATALLGDGK